VWVIGKDFRFQADVVVLAVPAADALQLIGEGDLLTSDAAYIMQNVEYDSRVCIAFAFDIALESAAAQYFGAQAEQTLDYDFLPATPTGRHLHMLCWQNAKRDSMVRSPVVITVHSTCGASVEDTEAAAVEALAEAFQVSPTVLLALLQDKKVVDWKTCQVVRP
ncbi:unnamed protein product, partial [Polarella glacialis]